MNQNVEIWDKLKSPPQHALKQIKGGRLSGKTDINPQWRYQAMTEVFGVCGVGWKYDIIRTWNEEGSDGQRMAFVEVKVYTKDENNVWSDGIPGIGGSMLIANEKNGLYTSDEGYKMATTDALSVALKMLGVGADIYMGMNSGSKYDRATPEPEAPHTPITDTHLKHLEAQIKQHGLDREAIKSYVSKYFGVEHFKEMTEDSYEALIKVVNKKIALKLKEQAAQKQDTIPE